MTIKRAIYYVFISILSLTIALHTEIFEFSSSVQGKNSSFIQTSMFNIMQGALDGANNVLDNAVIDSADLSLESVRLKKVGDSYQVIARIKNQGSYVRNLKVMIANNLTREHILISNGPKGLTLKSGEEFVSDEYFFEMDKRFSGADVRFFIKILNDEVFEPIVDNNYKIVSVDEYRSRIDDFYISNIVDENTYLFDYKLNDFLISETGFEVFVSDSLKFDEAKRRYRESHFEGRIFPFYEIEVDEKIFNSGNFKKIPLSSSFPFRINLFENAKNNEQKYYFMLKVYFEYGNSKRYKLSNILEVKQFEKLRRDDLFSVLSKISDYYPDVSEFGRGYLSRGQVIKYLFDFFEVDTEELQSKKIFFKDVSPGAELYPYVQALKKFETTKCFTDHFASNEKITKDLLYLLIDEFTKNY